MATRILVPGATGATGRLIVRDAVADGHAVVALVRPGRRAADLPGAEVEEGDARDEGALSRALAGCDGVVSALGSGASPFREVIVLCVATRAVVAAMARGGVRRLVCITGLGAGDSRGHGGLLYDRLVLPLLLRNVYRDKDRQRRRSAPARSSGSSSGPSCSTTSRPADASGPSPTWQASMAAGQPGPTSPVSWWIR